MERKVFNIGVELDADFVDALNELLHERFPENIGTKLAQLNGFAPEQLGYTTFIDKYLANDTVADASIDGNSNVHHHDVVTLEHEMIKPHEKLLSFNKIFFEIKKKFGVAAAQCWLCDEWIGRMYMHDGYNASMKSYCYAFDVDAVARKGLFFLENYNAEPPKHFTTFNQMVVETISYLSNRQAGAVGLPSYLIWAWWFWWVDCQNGYYIKEPGYYRDQCLQEIIYRLNQPFLRNSIESAFTNFSIFDRPYFEAFFGDLVFPDGTLAIDHEEDIIQFEKDFMRLEAEIRSANMMTYPVLSFSLQRVGGKFVDEEFARWACEFNMLWNDSNFLVTEEITSAASCCFSADTEVLWRSTEVGVNRTTFKSLFDTTPQQRHNFKIFHNGSWVQGDLIKLPATGHKMYKVTLANKKEMVVTDNHMLPTVYGDTRADELTVNDYVMVNTMTLNEVDSRKGYGYDEGYLLGMYLGDGSRSGESGIVLSITEKKYERSFDKVCRAVKSIDEEANVNMRNGENNVWFVYVGSQKVRSFIFDYVSGYHAQEKTISMDCLLESAEFRRGIIDGMYATDGGNSNRMYTSSPTLAKDLETILTSLGRQSVIDCSNRTNEPVVIRGVAWKRNFPLWCVRFYSDTNKRNFVNVYKTINNCTYFKVVSVEEVSYDDDFVYCFEMKNQDEPYFTLPNGVITHNCRLVSDVTNVDKDVPLGVCNSIGGTSLNVGSVKVNTINLARLAYETVDTDRFLNLVYYQTWAACRALDAQRNIIKRNIEKGLLPNFSSGLIHMERMFSTVGIIGLYEACEHFGLIAKDQFGYVHYTDEAKKLGSKVFDIMHRTQDAFKRQYGCDYQFNIEQIPAERAAVVLKEKDQLFYPNEAYTLPAYSNQFCPLGVKTTMQERVEIDGLYDAECNSGCILHFNLDAPLKSADTAWELMNYICDQGVTYFAFVTRISACKHNHGFYGNVCPICGEPKDTEYTKIVGFLTPVKTWSKERKEEFKCRDWMDLNRMEDLQ